MNECPRETEIVTTLIAGRSPDSDHLGGCAACAELAHVVTLIRRDAGEAAREANVPPSGAVWWRMQRRTQREAARSAARTVNVVYAVTLAATVVAALAVLGGMSVLQDVRLSVAIDWTFPLLLAIPACLLLAPVAIYCAVTD